LNDRGGRLADWSKFVEYLVQRFDLIKMDSEHQAIFAGDPVALRDLVHPFCFFDYFLQLSGHRSHANKSAHSQSDGLRIDNGLETGDYAKFLQALDPLRDGWSGHFGSPCELRKGSAAILL
jgi:hypothetical protein